MSATQVWCLVPHGPQVPTRATLEYKLKVDSDHYFIPKYILIAYTIDISSTISRKCTGMYIMNLRSQVSML